MRLLAAFVVVSSVSVFSAFGGDAEPTLTIAQQNELVEKRCVVCHKNAAPAGALTLEGFDAARPDPAVAHMMAIKIRDDGAIGAAGAPAPDRPTADALVRALLATKETTPRGWDVQLTLDPSKPNGGHHFVTARSTSPGAYELTMSCNGQTLSGNVQVARGAGSDRVAVSARPAAAPGEPLASAFDVDGTIVRFPIADLSPTIRNLFASCLKKRSEP